jgi:threonine dehydrogenase-like Zn-dependent dehydrogenase
VKESPSFLSLPIIVYLEYLRFFLPPILACDQVQPTRNTMSPIDPTSSNILIIGCGTWGSSTALWLARSGYKNVTVLDPYPVPSAISAGNDVNK